MLSKISSRGLYSETDVEVLLSIVKSHLSQASEAMIELAQRGVSLELDEDYAASESCEGVCYLAGVRLDSATKEFPI
jgi:hypothetical protein